MRGAACGVLGEGQCVGILGEVGGAVCGILGEGQCVGIL